MKPFPCIEQMEAVLDALGVPWRSRYVRRVTLVLDAAAGATLTVEEYPGAPGPALEDAMRELRPGVVVTQTPTS